MSILYEERLDDALPDVDRTSVLMALREHVPGLEILHTDEEIIPYECDGLSAYRTRPLLVVLPKQMEQVTAILAVCHRLRVPVVTRGAGTGMLGVTTEVTLKLLPKPPVARVLLASFDSVEKAGLAVGDIIANGIIPGGLEMMDNLSIRAAEDFIHAGYPVDAEAILLCELDGVESDVQEDCERVNDILLKAGATDVRLAQDEAERVRFWAGRKNAFPAVGRISPDYYCMDGTIPRRALPGVLEGIARLSQQYDLRVANVFHAGDGNMHPLILFDANEPGEFARAEELGGKILELCVEVGGSISGEHGIGREKINQMCAQFNSDEITTFHAVKAAFDPDGLLNPGKNIPTLHRCAEFGAMHVHHGHLPFPELERF